MLVLDGNIYLWASRIIKRILQAYINEPPHDKTNKVACAPSEDSDQTGHPDQSLRCPHEESLGP